MTQANVAYKDENLIRELKSLEKCRVSELGSNDLETDPLFTKSKLQLFIYKGDVAHGFSRKIPIWSLKHEWVLYRSQWIPNQYFDGKKVFKILGDIQTRKEYVHNFERNFIEVKASALEFTTGILRKSKGIVPLFFYFPNEAELEAELKNIYDSDLLPYPHYIIKRGPLPLVPYGAYPKLDTKFNVGPVESESDDEEDEADVGVVISKDGVYSSQH